MTSFLFWNLNRKPLQKFVVNLAWRYKVDVLMLVECSVNQDLLLKTLEQCHLEYYYAPGLCEKVEIFTRHPQQFIKPVYEENRLTIRHLKLPGTKDILLAVTHFPSKLHWSDSSQYSESEELAKSIRLGFRVPNERQHWDLKSVDSPYENAH